MYDTGKVMFGIAVFVLVVASPLLYNLVVPATAEVPELVGPPNGSTECVLEKATMRATHMDLLNQWRDEVVRRDERTFVMNDKGEPKSLTLTCLRCHSNKSQFCDRCHDYMAVAPYCWDCHVVPPEPGTPQTGEVQ